MVLFVYHSIRAYKLYDPIREKVVISRDVVFDESKGWDWGKSNNNLNGKTFVILEELEQSET